MRREPAVRVIKLLLPGGSSIYHTRTRKSLEARHNTRFSPTMAEISPVPMTADYKTELNCWEETMEPNKSPDNESEFVEVGVTESNVQDVAICHTYTVGSEDSGSLPCESGSPVASEHLKVEDRPAAVGYGYQEYDLSVQRDVSPQVFTVDQQQEDPHQLSVEPCSVVMPNCRDGVHQPPPPPSYGSEALTQLANCCSQLNDQLQNGSMVSPVVNIPDTHQGQSSIHVQLESAELWQQFFSVDTEMIITKAGRYERNLLLHLNADQTHLLFHTVTSIHCHTNDSICTC